MSGVDELRAYLAARDDAEGSVAPFMRSRIIPGTGGDVVVLLHGLTASPPAWRAIAAALAARGATVVVPRLPLHGHVDRMTTALRGMHAQLLLSDLHELLERVGGLGRPITLAGHSLGGTLSVHAATHMPAVVRVVAIAPFLGISFIPHETHAALVPLIRALPDLFLWWDPLLREKQQPDHGYPRYPLRALGTGLGIADAVYARAHQPPSVPHVDLVVNAGESSVNNRAVLRLARRWRGGGASVAVHALEGLSRSHDIIESTRPHAVRAHATIVSIIAGEHDPNDRVIAL